MSQTDLTAQVRRAVRLAPLLPPSDRRFLLFLIALELQGRPRTDLQEHLLAMIMHRVAQAEGGDVAGPLESDQNVTLRLTPEEAEIVARVDLTLAAMHEHAKELN